MKTTNFKQLLNSIPNYYRTHELRIRTSSNTSQEFKSQRELKDFLSNFTEREQDEILSLNLCRNNY